MEIRSQALGRVCLWISLAALYILLGLKVFVALREGLWLDWPLGDFLPDVLVRWVFSLESPPVRSVLAWVLSRDVLHGAAALSLVLWLLTLSGNASAPSADLPG